MLRAKLIVLLSAVSILALLPLVSIGQEAPATESPAKPTDGQEKTAEYRGPLPFYFGKLGLSDSQKTQLYKIDDEFDAKIKALERQIEELGEQRDQQMEKHLTPGQKLRLKELRAEANARDDETESPEQNAAS